MINWFKKLFTRSGESRDWASLPVRKPVDESEAPKENDINSLAVRKLEKFGDDKVAHFHASKLAMYAPFRDHGYSPSNIMHSAIMTLQIGVEKEYRDRRLPFYDLSSYVNASFILANALKRGANDNIDEGDVLADLAGIGIGIYEYAYGELLRHG